MLSIYKASAGSGKTYTLTREYLRMLLTDSRFADIHQLPHSRILAVTFTKKSTAEMKERILRELFILANHPEKSDYIKDFLKDKRLNLNQEQLQQRARQLLIDILQDYTRFSVSTIDGFFQQVIRTFALELGLSASYDISMDNEEIIQEAVDEIFKRIRTEQETNQELAKWIADFAQKNIDDDRRWNPNALVKSFSKELLKESLMRRMDDIQEAFSNKELIRQYQQDLQDLCDTAEDSINTLLQQANDIFAQHDGWSTHLLNAFKKPAKEWLTANIGTSFDKALEDPTTVYLKKYSKAQQQLLANIFETQLLPIFEQLHTHCYGKMSCDYFTAKAILPHLYTLGILQDVDKQIRDTDLTLGRLPISKTNQFVNQVIDEQDAPFIYERIGQYYRHYMIDEFQDTSTLQWENFSPLIREAEGNSGDNLIVGDVKQSIYRFRNSDWHLLNAIDQQFHQTISPRMEDNWRTAPVIIQENEKILQGYSQYVADKIDEESQDDHYSQDLRNIYHMDNMHQKAQQASLGYFHMQFFDATTAKEDTLNALDKLLQSFIDEGIDLKRVTILTRYSYEAAEIAKYLIQRQYSVQSAQGMQVGSHPTVKTIINLLQDDWQDEQSITRNAIQQFFGTISEQQTEQLILLQSQPLYQRIQNIIDLLQLSQKEGAAPYLTAFQNIVYSFSNSRVADTQAFLDYWERKKDKFTIPAAKASNTIQIMNIHSSKGLEFDIVIIPKLSWPLASFHRSEILWCAPQEAPFNTLPLVAVRPNSALKQSHFKKEYIQEMVAQYMDNLNLTYVALTRPRYRLYAFGEKYKTNSNGKISIQNIGQLFSYLYATNGELDEQFTYARTHDGGTEIAPLPPMKKESDNNALAQYISSPLNNRLTLRSRSEDDFAENAELSAVNIGILMHLWLSRIQTWADAETALLRLIREGQATSQQATEMRVLFQQLQQLIQREGHNQWFEDDYQVLSERDIITSSGTIQRPDRVMIKGKKAIVVDYKFGQQKLRSHLEQVRDYMALLSQMGYTTEGYIIYAALNEIHNVKC